MSFYGALCHQAESTPQPLPAGGCTGHHGRTLHYTRGNSSGDHRRAFIVNFRPAAMVEFERNNDYDHGLSVGGFHPDTFVESIVRYTNLEFN